MCTAISYHGRGHFFGRNLDLEYSYEERVCITPRKFPFAFRRAGRLEEHYAMIGTAYVYEEYPLYYDANNEKGLSMAGLLFDGNAYYGKEEKGKDNVSPFELIPWILGQCGSVKEAKVLLQKLCLVEIPFSEKLQLTPLHWMVADKNGCLVVEAMRDGLKIHENPIGVLTNNPPFPYQMMHLNGFRGLSGKEVPCTFAEGVELLQYSRGMGALGLPGDLSSPSRFVRAAFHKLNAEEAVRRAMGAEIETETAKRREKEVHQFFHLLGSVEMPWGSLELEGGAWDRTIYSSGCDTEKGIYYYRTYENTNIVGVDLFAADYMGEKLTIYEWESNEILIQNRKMDEKQKRIIVKSAQKIR